TNSNQWTITPGFGFSYASPTVPGIYKGTVTYSVPPVIDGRRDVNQDAMPDLIWENDATRQIVAWSMGGAQGNNLLGWSYLSPETVPGWHAVASADFNGGGTPDLVWQNEATGQVVVWYLGGAQGDQFLSYK